MERDSGQISVDSTPFQQHQFFPGGGGAQLLHPSGRSPSGVDRGESPWLAGGNWSSSGSQNGECSSRRDEWHTNSWDWDSVAFTAQRPNGATGATEGPGWDISRRGANDDFRKESEVKSRGRGTSKAIHQVIQIDDDDETELRGQTFFGRETPSPPLNESNPYNRGDDSPEDDGPLSLKLGGNVYEYLEENGVRNGKHGRSSSPQSQLPTCQVDGCTADLSKAKDYHRRHKVCEMHSKEGKTLVGRVMQRFCQQCSKFHPLDQFDEGKRSCRRRLAGHNKRRRKTQPDPAVSQAFMMAEGQANGKSSDILTLLSVLSKIQGPLEWTNNAASDQDILLRCLRQAGCLPTNGLEDVNRVAPSWSQLLCNSDLVTSQVDPSLLMPQSSGLNALLSPAQQEAYSLLIQNNLKQVARAAEENIMSSVGMNGLSGTMPYGLSVADAPISQAGPFLRHDEQASTALGMPHSPLIRLPGAIDPAQLLASVALTMQQNSQVACQGSHYSANGHSMAAPLQNVPPPCSSVETRDFINERVAQNPERNTSSGSQVDRQAVWLTNAASNSHKGLFSETQQALQRPSIDLQRHPSQQGSDSSQSGSPSGQQSPGTPEAIWENRNSRISIKLFDKHPGQFPEGLRSQIDKWLSHRPSDMESYIRPGCIILTIFLSMPKSAWVEGFVLMVGVKSHLTSVRITAIFNFRSLPQLVEDLSGSLKRLLISSSCDFWCTGRILVQVEQQSVLIIDGKIIGCRLSDPLSSPYIQSVRPLAIMSGQQTSLVVTGLNLTKMGTRLLCAFKGKYLSEEVFEHYGTDDEEVTSGGVSDAEEDSIRRQEETDGTIAVSTNPVPNAADDQTRVATPFLGGEPTIVDKAEVSGEVSMTVDRIYDEHLNPTRIQALVQVNESFCISGMSSSSFGRCFIEVDQDTLEGNWKPIIVADGPICAEVCTLEHEIEAAAHKAGEAAKQQGLQPSAVHCCMELARLVEEEEVACFLHELGWFFQRTHVQYCDGSSPASQVSSLRLRQLLVYSVERNWCAVVTKLLDIAFGNEDFDAAFIEFSAALQEEVSLLHRAVRKKCRPMVELLLSYAPAFLSGINDTNSRSFKQKLQFNLKWGSIFKPDMRGPAGLTPLHIAATIKDAEHIVDALTSDPCQVGLHAWLTAQDDSGETPLSCALMGGNKKALQLVRAKLFYLGNPESTSIHINPDTHWDQHLRGDSLVQLELPVWKTSSIMEIPEPPRDTEPVNCRDVDFLRLPPHVGGVKGAIYRPFLVSIMSIACICVCVCLLLKSPPHLEYGVSPFNWKHLEQGFQ